MKAIMVMFDSLNKRMLPPYGCDWTHAPNFTRLARRSVTFDNAWAGSLPCMPARREIHTGRYNFLHRSWGPLEPFDDSMPELLRQNGVHTHLASDHKHYWEDGGATYHGRYSTWEFCRGQEGDPWKGQVTEPEIPDAIKKFRTPSYRQDWINRQHMDTEDQHPQTLTFDAGLKFLHTNAAADCWFIQVETFDPHEPFFSHKSYKDLYAHDYGGPHFDWPDYGHVTQSPDQVQHARYEYAALLSMCDHSLGRVLDAMDELSLWDDTMLIVNTDHGFLLGEKWMWGKGVHPWFNELVNLPLFVWDPRTRCAGQRRDALVQTIDLAPTLLDYFGVEIPEDMQGAALPTTADTPTRTAALFGAHGGHVNVTDGRYVYMRAPVRSDNVPLEEYTLMPTHMHGRFSPTELADAQLAEPFGFTKGIKPLRITGRTLFNPYVQGSLLFDLDTDPGQQNPIIDDSVEMHMAALLVAAMRHAEAPTSQYQRLGLPKHGPVQPEHLRLRVQDKEIQATNDMPELDEFSKGRFTLQTPIQALLADPDAAQVLRTHLPAVADTEILQVLGPLSIRELAAAAGGLVPAAVVRSIGVALAEIT